MKPTDGSLKQQLVMSLQMCSFSGIRFYTSRYIIVLSSGQSCTALLKPDFKETPTVFYFLIWRLIVFMKAVSFELYTSVTFVAVLTLQLLTQASL